MKNEDADFAKTHAKYTRYGLMHEYVKMKKERMESEEAMLKSKMQVGKLEREVRQLEMDLPL